MKFTSYVLCFCESTKKMLENFKRTFDKFYYICKNSLQNGEPRKKRNYQTNCF